MTSPAHPYQMTDEQLLSEADQVALRIAASNTLPIEDVNVVQTLAARFEARTKVKAVLESMAKGQA